MPMIDMPRIKNDFSKNWKLFIILALIPFSSFLIFDSNDEGEVRSEIYAVIILLACLAGLAMRYIARGWIYFGRDEDK